MTNIRFTPLITYLFTAILLIAPLIITGCAPLNQTGGQNPWSTPPATEEENAAEPLFTPAPPSPSHKPIIKSEFDNLPPVNVAILLPLSGSRSALGQSMLQGAQLAMFEMGYNNFNLMPRDTAGTQNGAAAAATSAINDGAQLILGPLFSDSVRAVKPIARSKNINIIAFSTDWTLADNNTFLMGFMPFSQVNRIASYALSKGYKNYGLIAAQDTYGNAVSGQFSEVVLKNGGSLIKSIRYNNGDTGVTNQIATLKPQVGQSPDFNAVFMPVGGNQTDLIASALSYNNLPPAQVKRLGTGLWDDKRIAAEPNMQGGWFAAPSPTARRSFEQKYTAAYGSAPARLATLAYDATALSAILAKNGYQKSNRPAYDYASLTNQNGFAGTDGIFRFQRNGIVERKLSILELRNGRIVEIDPAPARF